MYLSQPRRLPQPPAPQPPLPVELPPCFPRVVRLHQTCRLHSGPGAARLPPRRPLSLLRSPRCRTSATSRKRRGKSSRLSWIVRRKKRRRSSPCSKSCINNLKCIRSKSRKWERNHNSSKSRRATPRPAASATRQNLQMDAAITVHIAKPSSVLVVEVECHYAQTRLCGCVICAENNKKSSLSRARGFTIVGLIHRSSLIKRLFEGFAVRKPLRRRRQNCMSRRSSRDPPVTHQYLQLREVELMGSQDRILLRMAQE